MQQNGRVSDGRIVQRFPGGVVCDVDWQYPAITERHAFEKAKEFLIPSDDVCYLAFPWATLIDLLQTRNPRSSTFKQYLDDAAQLTRKYTRVITVCQHIRQAQYVGLLEGAGVTDVFWSHATRDLDQIGSRGDIHVYPFPLYPVNALKTEERMDITTRPYLFSFIGAKANQWYLTQSRNHIIELLASDPRGLVVSREAWHYQKVVYDYQIHRRISSLDSSSLQQESSEFKTALAKSKFVLCPSGSGPNSIRLWEAIASDAIPVVLADTYRPPGAPALWDMATVQCEEDPESIRMLPDRLEKLAADASLLEAKLAAVRQLNLLYGSESFIYDIAALYLSIAEQRCLSRISKQYVPGAWMLELLKSVGEGRATDAECTTAARTIVTWSILDPEGFRFQSKSGMLLPVVNELKRSSFLDPDTIGRLREVCPLMFGECTGETCQ